MVGETRDAAGEGRFIVAVVKRSRRLLKENCLGREESLVRPRETVHREEGGEEEEEEKVGLGEDGRVLYH